MKTIFVLQVRRVEELDKPRRNEKRNIGWFNSFNEAEESLKANTTVFSDDGYYNLALIEEVPPGPYSIGMCMEQENIHWYRLSEKGYVDAPELLEPGTIGYTMG